MKKGLKQLVALLVAASQASGMFAGLVDITQIDIDITHEYNCHKEGVTLNNSDGNNIQANCNFLFGTVGETRDFDVSQVKPGNKIVLGSIDNDDFIHRKFPAPQPNEDILITFKPSSGESSGKEVELLMTAEPLTQALAQKEGVLDAYNPLKNQTLMSMYKRVKGNRESKFTQLYAQVSSENQHPKNLEANFFKNGIVKVRGADNPASDILTMELGSKTLK